MTKKELSTTMRPMFGMRSLAPIVSAVLMRSINCDPLKTAGAAIQRAPTEDKDATIRDLRAKIEQLEARETKRKAQTRERTRKARAKPECR